MDDDKGGQEVEHTAISLVAGSLSCRLERVGDLASIRIENDQACARVFFQGAQITHYQRKNDAPILWCSPLENYRVGSAIRGGIPVCFPWFGSLDRNPASVQAYYQKSKPAPAHGWVRQINWVLTGITESLSETALTFSLPGREFSGVDMCVDVELTIVVGSVLSLSLKVTNTGEQRLPFTHAFHSYLNVDEVDGIKIRGLDKVSYIDALEDWQEFLQQGDISVSEEIDRVYINVPDVISLDDPKLNRSITLSSQQQHSAIVWNPWINKSKELTCFPLAGYKSMVCIETGNALANAVDLSPKEQAVSQTTIQSVAYE